MTKKEKELLAQLEKVGDDLVNAIANAAWDQYLLGPTPHMRTAIENWKWQRGHMHSKEKIS